jgi:hypothetical protein
VTVQEHFILHSRCREVVKLLKSTLDDGQRGGGGVREFMYCFRGPPYHKVPEHLSIGYNSRTDSLTHSTTE